MIDKHSFLFLFRVETVFLFDKNKSCRCADNNKENNGSHHASYRDIKAEKGNNGDKDCNSKPCKVSSTDTHKFIWFLQAFENRETAFLHNSYPKNDGRASAKHTKATQPPIVSIQVFLTSWSPFCILM